MDVVSPVGSETDWRDGIEEWQTFSPLTVHLLGFCVMHSSYDLVGTVVKELASKYASHLRVDELAFFTWNWTSLLMHLWSLVFSYYLWHIDFSMTHVAMHTWTTLFFSYFIIDVLYILKVRVYFKEKILRFLVLHHFLTFGVCLLYITAYTAPQFVGQSGPLSMLPTLWNSSSAVSNALFLYRLYHGVSKIDNELLYVTVGAFVVQRTWRILAYVACASSPYGTVFSKIVMMSPGFIMDAFDSMSQTSAIKLIQRKIREEREYQATSRQLLDRLLREQVTEVEIQSRSPTPSPKVAKRQLNQAAMRLSPSRFMLDEKLSKGESGGLRMSPSRLAFEEHISKKGAPDALRLSPSRIAFEEHLKKHQVSRSNSAPRHL